MRYSIIILACLSLILMFMSSCGEDAFATTVELEQPEVEKRIVVNAFVQKEEQEEMRIYVGRNVGVLEGGSIYNEDDIYSLSDATVHVDNLTSGDRIEFDYNPDSEDVNWGYDDYNYINTSVPADFFQAGNQYTFSVQQAEYGPSNTTINYPNQTAIESFVFEEDGGINEDGDDASTITFTFQDEPGVVNFYEVSVLLKSNDPNSPGMRYIWVYSSDLAHSRGQNEIDILLTDDSFDGELKTFEIKIDQFYTLQSDTDIILEFRTVNEGYYRHSKTLYQASLTNGNPFASPVQVHTNVDNGLGVITLKSYDAVKVN